MSEKKNETTKKEEKKEAKEAASSKYDELIKKIEAMTVVELNEFVEALESKFGPVTMAAPASGGGAGAGEAEASAEKSAFDIELTSAGSSKIPVIKVVKEITDKSLAEAKQMVDSAPVVIKESVPKEEAEELKKKLEEAGATVSLK
jgi:large subunit ribosomal protein L7/L12